MRQFYSGYRVRVRSVGPFTFSHILQKYAPTEPVYREVELGTGEVARWKYELPEETPDPSDAAEYALYARYREWIEKEEKRQSDMEWDRAEFFKINCIDVGLFPFRLPNAIVRVYKFLARLLSGTVQRIPFRSAYLRFLDIEVISSREEWLWIQQNAIVPEVTLDSIIDAAHSFRDSVGETTAQPRSARGDAAVG